MKLVFVQSEPLRRRTRYVSESALCLVISSSDNSPIHALVSDNSEFFISHLCSFLEVSLLVCLVAVCPLEASMAVHNVVIAPIVPRSGDSCQQLTLDRKHDSLNPATEDYHSRAESFYFDLRQEVSPLSSLLSSLIFSPRVLHPQTGFFSFSRNHHHKLNPFATLQAFLRTILSLS